MKRFLFSLTALCLLVASCSVQEMDRIQDTAVHPEREVFYGTLESNTDPETRVHLDENIKILWDHHDLISIFNNSTQNQEFRFEGESGENSGTFEQITPDGAGSPLDYKCAVYPYLESTSISNSGVLTLTLPAKQAFRIGSFGPGANVMVSVTDNTLLRFKNIGGYLGLKFYGTGSISSIKIEGNNGEHLSGLATLSPAIGEIPTVSLPAGSGTSITLSCDTPVELNAAREDSKLFWMVVPPTVFSKGFRLTVTAPDGSVFVKETAKELTVTRNSILRIAPVEVVMTQPEVYNIENDYVSRYMNGVDYSDDPNYTYSSIYGSNSYLPKSFRTGDRPKPVSLSWTGGKASKVRLWKSPSFEGTSIEVDASSSPVDIYNLIPGEIYYYRVFKADGTILKEGSLRPEGPVRMIHIGSHSDNMRDLGGWRAGDKTIRYGRLYRGALIDGISDEEKNTFIGLGIGLDMELRGYKSDEANVSPVISEIDWCQFKLLKYLGVTETAGKTEELYRAAIKKIISYLKEDGRAVYFHCAGGADRTGALAFLIEAILGVSESDMSKEFELTSMTVKNKRYRHMTQNGSSFTSTEKGYPYKDMIMYLRTFPGATMQEHVTNWAMTGENALTATDISDLKALLLE